MRNLSVALQRLSIFVSIIFLMMGIQSCGGSGGGIPTPDPQDQLPTQANWPPIPLGQVVSGSHGQINLTGGTPIEIVVYEDGKVISDVKDYVIDVPTGSHTTIDYDIFVQMPGWVDGGRSVGNWTTVQATDWKREGGGEYWLRPTFAYGNDALRRIFDSEFLRSVDYDKIVANYTGNKDLLKDGEEICGKTNYEIKISANDFRDMISEQMPPRPAPPSNGGSGGGDGIGWGITGIGLLAAIFIEPQDKGSIDTCTKYQAGSGGNNPPTPHLTNAVVTPSSATKQIGETQQYSGKCYDQFGNVLTGAHSWSISPGSVATINQSGLVTAVSAGTATITFTCMQGGVTVTATAMITVQQPAQKMPPTVQLTADVYTGVVSQKVNFTATASDSDGSIVKYSWDLDGDGGFEDHTGTENRNYRVYQTGTYDVKVRVTDNDGLTAVASVQIVITDGTVTWRGLPWDPSKLELYIIPFTVGELDLSDKDTQPFVADAVYDGNLVTSDSFDWETDAPAGSLALNGNFDSTKSGLGEWTVTAKFGFNTSAGWDYHTVSVTFNVVP